VGAFECNSFSCIIPWRIYFHFHKIKVPLRSLWLLPIRVPFPFTPCAKAKKTAHLTFLAGHLNFELIKDAVERFSSGARSLISSS
jgi:hypothetical protein